MRFTIAVLTVFTFFVLTTCTVLAQEVATPVQEASASSMVAQGQLDGSNDAGSYSSGKYTTGGLISGFVGGLIGTAIAYAVTSGRDVDIPAEKSVVLVEKPAEYQMGYRESYTRVVQKKRKRSSLTGGLIGTAAFVAIVAVASGT